QVADALAEVDLDFAALERRGELVLDHRDARADADAFFAFLNLLRAAHLNALAGEKLQLAAAGCGFRVAEHNADLFAHLVDHHQTGAALVAGGRQLAHGFAHHTREQTHLAVAHLALELGLGHKGRDTVHHNDVYRVAVDQRFGDVQRLLTIIG